MILIALIFPFIERKVKSNGEENEENLPTQQYQG